MKIFADQNILALEEYFFPHGELHYFDGRSVEQADLLDAEVLLVRSITRVDRALLEGTRVRFVGTATSGIDHIDTNYLHEANIHFVDAKGCNANAVVDYCFSAIAIAGLCREFTLEGSSVGIVGAGAVGGLFASKLEELGVEVRCCDPYLEQAGQTEREYFSLAAALECDVVSLHVPLSESGSHPTRGLLGDSELKQLPAKAILINACRGGIVDEVALKNFVLQRSDVLTVFDVWADEPSIDSSLAQRIDIATPHIAGYSQEAKSEATRILAREFCKYFELELAVLEEAYGGHPDTLVLDAGAAATEIWPTLLAAFPLDDLSRRFKHALAGGNGVGAFDFFRQELLQRKEFKSKLLVRSRYSGTQQDELSTLGFRFD